MSKTYENMGDLRQAIVSNHQNRNSLFNEYLKPHEQFNKFITNTAQLELALALFEENQDEIFRKSVGNPGFLNKIALNSDSTVNKLKSLYPHKETSITLAIGLLRANSANDIKKLGAEISKNKTFNPNEKSDIEQILQSYKGFEQLASFSDAIESLQTELFNQVSCLPQHSP